MSLWEYPFYGLPVPVNDDGTEDYSNVARYRMEMHKSILYMCYQSQGAFTWDMVYYRMPIYLRIFNQKLLQDIKEKEQEQKEKANRGSSMSPGSIPKGPGIKSPGKLSTAGKVPRPSGPRKSK